MKKPNLPSQNKAVSPLNSKITSDSPMDASIEKHEDVVKHFNHLSIPFSIFDNRNRKFIYCNNKFIKLTGLSEADCYRLEFKDFGKWIHPDDYDILHNQIGIRLRDLYDKNMNAFPISTFQFNFEFNFRIQEKDKKGNHISLLAQCSVIEWDEPNRPAIVLNQISDISNYNICNKIVFSINLFDSNKQQWVNILREEFINRPPMLTRREIEIFSYIIKDLTAVEISKLLEIAFFTVRTHWRNILSKTGCKTQKELKELAIKEGWV